MNKTITNTSKAKAHFDRLGINYPDSKFEAENKALSESIENGEIYIEEKPNIHIDVITNKDLGHVAYNLYEKNNVTARIHSDTDGSSASKIAEIIAYNVPDDNHVLIMFDSTEADMFDFNHPRVKLCAVCKEEPTQSEWEALQQWALATPNSSILNEQELLKRHPFASGISNDGSLLLTNEVPIKKTFIDVSKSLQEKDGQTYVDLPKLNRTFGLATRYALRETLFETENHRDRTIAIVPRNWTNFEKLENYDTNTGYELLSMLQTTVRETSESYCYALRIPLPLADTTYDITLDTYEAYDNMNHFYSSHNSCATVSKHDATIWEDIKENWDDHLYVQFA